MTKLCTVAHQSPSIIELFLTAVVDAISRCPDNQHLFSANNGARSIMCSSFELGLRFKGIAVEACRAVQLLADDSQLNANHLAADPNLLDLFCEIMHVHKGDAEVQRSACLALRPVAQYASPDAVANMSKGRLFACLALAKIYHLDLSSLIDEVMELVRTRAAPTPTVIND